MGAKRARRKPRPTQCAAVLYEARHARLEEVSEPSSPTNPITGRPIDGLPAEGVPSTTDIIMNRLAGNSRPGARNDPWRVALAVEGGGMRGVIPAGMLLALEQMGLRNSIDVVVGTSAGAIAGAFFITGLGSRVAPVYYRELNQAPFLNKRRLLRLQAAMDLDYLVDVALMDQGLSPHEVAHNPIPLYATVTPVDPEDHTRLFRVDGSDDRVRSILKATASLPVLGGPAKVVDDREYVDGGMLSQIPWRHAADLDATHILALPSRPINHDKRGTINLFERYTVLPLIRSRHGDHVAQATNRLSDLTENETVSLMALGHGLATGLRSDGQPWTGDLEFVELDEDVPLPDRLETERPVLVDGMRNGAQAMLNHFGLNNIVVEHRITLDHPAARIGHYRSGALGEIVAASHQARRAERR